MFDSVIVKLRYMSNNVQNLLGYLLIFKDQILVLAYCSELKKILQYILNELGLLKNASGILSKQ